MCHRIIKREEAEALAREKKISLQDAKNQLKQSAIRVYFSNDTRPVFDEDGWMYKYCSLEELFSTVP